MSIAMDIIDKVFTSSPASAAAAAAAEVGDNFGIEFFRPCSMKEGDASDAESGVYKTMAHDEGDTEDEACSSLVEGVVFVNKCSSQVYRMDWAASSSDEEEEEDIVEGDEEQEERSVKDDRDPREEDRAFWKACLAHGYP